MYLARRAHVHPDWLYSPGWRVHLRHLDHWVLIDLLTDRALLFCRGGNLGDVIVSCRVSVPRPPVTIDRLISGLACLAGTLGSRIDNSDGAVDLTLQAGDEAANLVG